MRRPKSHRGLLLALLAAPASSAEPCRPQQLASLSLTVTDGGELLAPMKIGGESALLFLNTGSGRSGLYRDHVRTLRASASPAPAPSRADRVAVTENVRLNSVWLAEQRLGTVRFNVINTDSPPVRVQGEPVAVEGVLGTDLLAQYDYELDLADRRLNIYSQDHCRGQGAYWSSQYQSLPLTRSTTDPLESFVVIEVNDRRIEATLSTGSAHTWLSTDVSRALYQVDRDSPELVALADAAASSARYYPISLTLQQLRWPDYPVLLANAERPNCRLRADIPDTVGYVNCSETPLQLGRDLLGQLRIFVANRERRIYFTANDRSIP